MYIEWLHVKNVRNLSDVRIEPGPKINVIAGPNGSGKTALLEAIHFLGRCRSFRTPGVNLVIQRHQEELRVSAGLRMPDKSQVVTGVERSRGAINIRYDNRDVSRVSEQAVRIPTITITSDSHRLVTGGPVCRRRWLDWAMFHVEPKYIEIWRNYHKALKHRNNLLKQNKEQQLVPWERAMWQAAETINRQRQAFLDELSSEMARIGRQLNIPLPKLEYDCGWQKGIALDQCLAEHRKEDLERGNTRHGVHRSDLLISKEGRQIGHFYSNGQIKLSLAVLSLAQGNTFRQRTGRNPILLVDDLPAELDGDSQSLVIRGLAEQRGQVFLTTTEESPAIESSRQKMFHVEHGRLIT